VTKFENKESAGWTSALFVFGITLIGRVFATPLERASSTLSASLGSPACKRSGFAAFRAERLCLSGRSFFFRGYASDVLRGVASQND
jgi:hypothetical protein